MCTRAQSLYKKGFEANENGNIREAIRFFEEASKQKPENFTYKTSLANMYMKSDQTDKALVLYDEILNAEQNVSARIISIVKRKKLEWKGWIFV